MLATLFALPLLSLAVLAEPHGHSSFQRHHQVAKRASSDVHLYEKKFSGARWSFYAAGQGACGGFNTESDFIVALNSEQYGSGYPGPQCFKMITMSLNGKTATAQIVDECPGCPYGGLDLSKGLFTHFASEDEGIVYGEWSFIDGGNDGGGDEETTTKKPETTKETWTWSPDPTTSKTKTKTTIQWTPEPTPEWTPEPTTEWTSSSEESTSSSKTKTKTKTKSSSTWSEPTSSSEWSSSSSSEPTSSATSSAAPTPTTIGGIELLGQAVLGMGNLMVNVAVAA